MKKSLRSYVFTNQRNVVFYLTSHQVLIQILRYNILL